MNFFNDLDSAVEFVKDLLQHSPDASVSITTTLQGKFAVFSALTVINSSSDDIELQTARFFSETQVNT